MNLAPNIDLFPILAAVLAAFCCGLLGNYLVLRRLSLMGDAMSHSVLPGLVIAFMLTGSRAAPVMFLGALMAGITTVVLVELIKRLGRVEPGAAMGVVFSVLFALGVLLIERVARNTDLDADCVLHGQLESLFWPDGPARWLDVLHPATLAAVPPQVWTLAITCAVSFVFVLVLYKELRLAAFDPALATAQGFHASILHYALMVLVAGATVAAFEAVGSILVIAMLIVPAAIARLLTDRMPTQLLMSTTIAVVAAVMGYLGSIALPSAMDKPQVNAAGSIAIALGVLFFVAMLFGPRYGVLATAIRRVNLTRRIALDDLLAALYRHEEGSPITSRFAPKVYARARRSGLVMPGQDTLTEAGRQRAAELIRRHRLWETYLVHRAGISADHAHEPAEHLEHLAEPLPSGGPQHDPHGKAIPPGVESGPAS